MDTFVVVDGIRLRAKEIEIDWDEWDEKSQEWKTEKKKTKIRKLMGGERDTIIVESIPMKLTGGIQTSQPNYKLLKKGYLLKGLVEAPFPINDKGIDSLDANLSDYLFQQIMEFNNLSDKKKAESD